MVSVPDGAVPALASRPRTLVILVSAGELEVTMLGPAGAELGARVRLPRAPGVTLEGELQAMWPQLEPLGELDRITVATSAVADEAADPAAWTHELARQSLRPVHAMTAVDLRWRPLLRHAGVEFVLWLGAELESALFLDGSHVPGLALGRHRFRKGRTYGQYLARRVLERKGVRAWNRRLGRAVTEVLAVWNPATLHLAGPGAAHVELELPSVVVVVRGPESLAAAVALWHPPVGGEHG